MDAVKAILLLLQKGEAKQALNVAMMTIKEMVEIIWCPWSEDGHRYSVGIPSCQGRFKIVVKWRNKIV